MGADHFGMIAVNGAYIKMKGKMVTSKNCVSDDACWGESTVSWYYWFDAFVDQNILQYSWDICNFAQTITILACQQALTKAYGLIRAAGQY